jgi:hypothetical protein
MTFGEGVHGLLDHGEKTIGGILREARPGFLCGDEVGADQGTQPQTGL